MDHLEAIVELKNAINPNFIKKMIALIDHKAKNKMEYKLERKNEKNNEIEDHLWVPCTPRNLPE